MNTPADQPQNTALITLKYGIHLIYLAGASFDNEVSPFFDGRGGKTGHFRN